jgi:hypothetical protein
MYGEGGAQVMRSISGFPVWALLFTGLHLSFFTGSVPAQSNDLGNPTLGRIVSIKPKEPKDNLRIQQAKRVAPVNATEGMLVRRGYVLILNPKARAFIVCGDGKKRELKPGKNGCPCTQPCTPEVCGIRYGGSTLSVTRGSDAETGAFPIVVSPRKTLLRNLRPTIRWLPVSGATQNTTYQVTLYGDNPKPLWSRDVVSEPRLAYPEKEPPLIPGETYKVVVTSGGKSSRQDPLPGLGFTALTAEQARSLALEEAQRKQLELPETQTRLLVANLYAAREMYAEAIEQLEELSKTFKEPEVLLLLGDLFATIGLSREAKKRYAEALGLTAAVDFAGLGQARKSLAQVCENLGDFKMAIEHLREAKKAYRRLRNRSMVRALFTQEQRLKKIAGNG